MNLFDLGKRLAEKRFITVPKDDNHNTFGEELDHLTEDGELPFGWIAHKRTFTEPIQAEFSRRLNEWISVREQEAEIDALQSLIEYIENTCESCRIKGECYFKWFCDCVADNDYIQKRKQELKLLMEK